jgi:hypothetical protein
LKNGAIYDQVGAIQQFVVDIRSYQHGWIRWQDQKPTHRYMGRKVDGFPLPVRSRLPEPELEGSEDDPWQETHSIVMRNMDGPDEADNLCTYTTTSWGGRKALGKLIDAYVKQAKEHPGQMPVVYLGSVDKQSPRGPVPNPVITIVDWTEFGAGASLPGRKLTAVPAIQGPPTTNTPAEEKPPLKRELDDEIPF